MQALQLLETYSKTTRDIEITISPEYLAEQSDPAEGVFSYSYTVNMRNGGSDAVQLINRHWIVLSGGVQIADVKGEGVVGEQPVLEPGEDYSYTSWTTVVNPVGSMSGSYTFYSESGEFFDVEVPQFELLYVDQNSVY